MHVKNCLSEIKDIKKRLIKLGVLDSKIITSLEYLEINLKEIKEHGQNMENRLRVYREAIEGLGFTRNIQLKIK